MAFPNNPTSPPVLELNSHAINTSCVGFWPLTQVSGTTATDISTGGNDGTILGTTVWQTEDIGNLLDIDGSTGYVNTGDWSLDSSTSFSVTAWIIPDNVSGDRQIVTRDGSSGAASRHWQFRVDSTLELIRFNSSGGVIETIAGATTLSTGTPYFVCFTFDSTSGSVIYLDGVSDATSANTTPNQSGTGEGILIGARIAGTPNNNWDGGIQNVRIWDRALSADDVALLYNRPWVGTDYDETFPYSPPVPSSMSVNTDALMTGCVAWWPLTETDDFASGAVDISGNSSNGTISGSVVSSVSSIGTAAEFDSTGDYITTGVPATYDTRSEPLAVSTWVKATSQTHTQRIVSPRPAGTGTGTEYPIALWVISTGRVRVQVYDGSGSERCDSTTAVDDGSWHHVVASISGGTVSLYVDGTLENTMSLASLTSTTSQTNNFMIGQNGNFTSAQQFIGEIQNTRIWSRALTADEVTLLYERPWEGESTYGDVFPNDPPPTLALDSGAAINTNLLGWWPLLETDDYASGAADISGNAYDGTKNGTVTSEPASLGTVANFDGSTGYFQHPNTLAQSFTNSFSVSFWARPESSASDQRAVANWILPGGTGTQWNAWLDVGGGAVGWAAAIYDQSGTYQIAGTTVASATLNEWQHVCATWSSSSTDLLVYVNAVEVASTTVSNMSASTASTSFQIGNSATESKYFDGDMQNVRVWSRALSAAEVQSLYETPWIGSNYTGVTTLYNYIYRSKRFRRL